MKICRARKLFFRKNRFFCSNPTQKTSAKAFNPEILKENIAKKETENQQPRTDQIKSFGPEILQANILKSQETQTPEEKPPIPIQSAEINSPSVPNDHRIINPELLKESIEKSQGVEQFDRTNKVILEQINDLGSLDILPTAENLINGFNDKYFNIGSVAVFGSVVVFPDAFFIWRVKDVFDITIESLSIFEVYSPVPTLLIVGTGHRRRDLDDEVIEHFSQKGISIEVYSSSDAASTLNFLLQEGRNVAGAFIPIGDKYKEQFRS
jgi:uncharacterized protein